MEAAAGLRHAAHAEALVFPGYFADLPDHWQRRKVTCPLEEVLLLCLLAVLAGAETFVDIARFHHALYEQCREQAQREASPTAAVIDSQSVKSAEKGGLH
jgi:hypothetical protein